MLAGLIWMGFVVPALVLAIALDRWQRRRNS